MNHAPTPATHVGDVKVKIQSFIFELKNALIVPKSNANNLPNFSSMPTEDRSRSAVQTRFKEWTIGNGYDFSRKGSSRGIVFIPAAFKILLRAHELG